MILYQAFSSEHLHLSAQLLATRHQHDVAEQSLLPEQFCDVDSAQQAIQAVLDKEQSSGFVALTDNTCVGYMLGALNPKDYLGDRSQGWVYLPAYASEDHRHLSELYARIADGWVKRGCYDHFTHVTASDRDLQEAWFSLSFGREQAHGLLKFDAIQQHDLGDDPSVEIRLTTPDDEQYFRAMAHWISQYQVWTPTFAPVTQNYLQRQTESFASLKDDDDAITYLMFKDGALVGYHIYYDVETDVDNMLHPSGAIELVVAATHPEMRGQGLGRRLAQKAFREMQQRGYDLCVTDWRTTNRASSYFWRSMGFIPTHYRLVRRLDDRIGSIYEELYS